MQAESSYSDFRPLAWAPTKAAVATSHCDGKQDCGLVLPVGIPLSCAPWVPPNRDPMSTNLLFAGCGFLGARFTTRSAASPSGVATEVWYEIDTGALVGTSYKGTDERITSWGTAPPADCRLEVCNPCSVIQKDPGTPPEHGLFGLRGNCDLADVGIDPAAQGEWRRGAEGDVKEVGL
jgi:hypothetical protein